MEMWFSSLCLVQVVCYTFEVGNFETLRRPKDIVHVALQHGKDQEELARAQFTTEHKKQVTNLVKYFSLYLQDLA